MKRQKPHGPCTSLSPLWPPFPPFFPRQIVSDARIGRSPNSALSWGAASELPLWAPRGALSGTCSSSPDPGQAVGQFQAMIYQDRKTSLFYTKPGERCSGVGIKSQNTWPTTQGSIGMKATSMSKERLINWQVIIVFISEFINNPEEPVKLPLRFENKNVCLRRFISNAWSSCERLLCVFQWVRGQNKAVDANSLTRVLHLVIISLASMCSYFITNVRPPS